MLLLLVNIITTMFLVYLGVVHIASVINETSVYLSY